MISGIWYANYQYSLDSACWRFFSSQPCRVPTPRRMDRSPPCKPREQSSACVPAAMRASLKLVLSRGPG
jgi:hypothetical protein